LAPGDLAVRHDDDVTASRDLLAQPLAGPAEVVAPRLVGARLRSTVGPAVTVVLTEVEAYGGVGADEASHAYRGLTARNSTMFGRPGLLYVYLSHGLHWCLNVVTGSEGRASAVLLRAGRVVEGIEVARERRPAARTDRDLARGPGRLGAALGMTGVLNGVDLLDPASPVRLLPAEPGQPPPLLLAGPRIGISKAVDRPWRWCWAGDRSVSR
jgi:DNA-3-methyladenine glycosylase